MTSQEPVPPLYEKRPMTDVQVYSDQDTDDDYEVATRPTERREWNTDQAGPICVFYLILGLRFDDCYDPMEDHDIKEAPNRLHREIVDARNQRLLRAMDLSMMHEYLPEDLQVLFLSRLFNNLVCNLI
ncbi:uncharacterized protein LOC110709499 [Chenopodium quinoa]|uniref:uncharacterized protein LOC110709499 n=1 Tax=Chenopodium quinoa TaxID=63459 RepID=UPI000B78D968|nr:uncharacterized protein LOC110709499 [Chenopodium quinoa]